MSEESLKPPDGLETAGRQLWDSVTATFVLNAGEVEILRQAAATADEISLLEAELRSSSLVVAGYSGQPRPNPLLKIIQDHRLLLRRLVDSLAVARHLRPLSAATPPARQGQAPADMFAFSALAQPHNQGPRGDIVGDHAVNRERLRNPVVAIAVMTHPAWGRSCGRPSRRLET
jgi:hypothetical protein